MRSFPPTVKKKKNKVGARIGESVLGRDPIQTYQWPAVHVDEVKETLKQRQMRNRLQIDRTTRKEKKYQHYHRALEWLLG